MRIEQSMVNGIKNKNRKKEKALITIVSAGRNGYRVEIGLDIVNFLNLQDCVKIGYSENALVLTKNGNLCEKTFCLRTLSSGKKVVYSKALVNEIIDTLMLDFEGCTSVSLRGAHNEKVEGKEYVLVYYEFGFYEEPMSEEEILEYVYGERMVK